ncbi:hypothetical protein BOTBODRAFT_32582 [Botryobasidium botryosum FD-172 SS1]|uniref:PB1 domain-containing protein n=1 Tax=Botryobasidium botryosum (strain FD-172 SS1) TaxID=930990 RepID=A0A067MIB7_BOTB1|nr:hypothetical protein BOTBODRAFT_32582 [Botryobasidium botryosum FD-172 SS1]
MALVTFKVAQPGGLTRKFSFARCPAWADLVAKISPYFDIPTATFAIAYTDGDGDQITISSDPELADYILALQGSTAKVIVKDLAVSRVAPSTASNTPRSADTILVDAPPFHARDDTPSQNHASEQDDDTASNKTYAGGFRDNKSTTPDEKDWESIHGGSAATATPSAGFPGVGSFYFGLPTLGNTNNPETTIIDQIFGPAGLSIHHDIPLQTQPSLRATPAPQEQDFTPLFQFSRSPPPPTTEEKGKGRAQSPVPSSAPSEKGSENEEQLFEDDPPVPEVPAPASAAATPSLVNDITALIEAFNAAIVSHPELSDGLRNLLRNATAGAYWPADREAVRNTAESVAQTLENAFRGFGRRHHHPEGPPSGPPPARPPPPPGALPPRGPPPAPRESHHHGGPPPHGPRRRFPWGMTPFPPPPMGPPFFDIRRAFGAGQQDMNNANNEPPVIPGHYPHGNHTHVPPPPPPPPPAPEPSHAPWPNPPFEPVIITTTPPPPPVVTMPPPPPVIIQPPPQPPIPPMPQRQMEPIPQGVPQARPRPPPTHARPPPHYRHSSYAPPSQPPAFFHEHGMRDREGERERERERERNDRQSLDAAKENYKREKARWRMEKEEKRRERDATLNARAAFPSGMPEGGGLNRHSSFRNNTVQPIEVPIISVPPNNGTSIPYSESAEILRRLEDMGISYASHPNLPNVVRNLPAGVSRDDNIASVLETIIPSPPPRRSGSPGPGPSGSARRQHPPGSWELD